MRAAVDGHSLVGRVHRAVNPRKHIFIFGERCRAERASHKFNSAFFILLGAKSVIFFGILSLHFFEFQVNHQG